MKKVISLVLTVAMLVCFMPTMAFAADETGNSWDKNGKIQLRLESGGTTAEATAFDDYTISATVKGTSVDASYATATLKMKNIAGLGIEGEKSATYTLNTGIDGKTDISLEKFLSNVYNFVGCNIDGKVNGNSFSYWFRPLEKNAATATYTYEGKTGNKAEIQKAWKSLTAMVKTSEGADDSKIFIPQGTSIQIGNEKLSFVKDVEINPSAGKSIASDAMKVENVAESTVEIVLPKGSKLQISSTAATLKKDVVITSDVPFVNANLSGIVNAQSLEELIVYAVVMFNDFVGACNDKSINLDIHSTTCDVTYVNDGNKEQKQYAYGAELSLPEVAEKDGYTFLGWYDAEGNKVEADTIVSDDMTLTAKYEAKPWAGKVQFELKSGETVAKLTALDDYSVVASIDGKTVDAGKATATLRMKNIAGLGITDERVATYELNTGITGMENTPLTYLQNVLNFEGCTLNGSVDGSPFVYNVTRENADAEGGHYAYKATPNSEVAVRTAWQRLTTEMVRAESGKADDSKIIIPADAYMQIGTERLEFTKECTVDPSSQNGLNGSGQAIRDAAQLKTDAKALDNNVEIYLPKGSSLQISSSAVTLKRGVTVRSNLTFSEKTPLTILRDIKEPKMMVAYFVALFNDAVGQANGKTLNVDIIGDYDVTLINGEQETVKTVKYGESVELETPEREGATFDGWYLGTKKLEGTTLEVTRDMDIVAKFIRNEPETPVNPPVVGPTEPTTPVDPNPPTEIEDPDTPLDPGTAAVKGMVSSINLIARSVRTNKKNVKVTVKGDEETNGIIKDLKDMGYTVKYQYFRSVKKKTGYKSMLRKNGNTYTNTIGKKGTRYYYRAQIRVYDKDGNLIAKSLLKQCDPANRIWKKK